MNLNVAVEFLNKPYRKLLVVLLCLCAVGAVAALPLWYVLTLNCVIGFCLLPFVVHITGKSRLNMLALVGVVVLGILSMVYHHKVFYFLALALAIIFFIDFFVGKVSGLVYFLIVFMSPVFYQVSVILGFPIRLLLSNWTGAILKAAGMQVEVMGNLIWINGIDFSVDEACMGLNMLVVSLLLSVFIIAQHLRRQKKDLRLLVMIIFFCLVFLFTVVSNLLRIILLVVFQLLPNNPWHEVVGLLCLFVYVLIPVYFLSKKLARNAGNRVSDSANLITVSLSQKSLMFMIGVFVLCCGFVMNPDRKEGSIEHAEVMYGQLPVEKMPGGISKVITNDILLYVKPIPDFFSMEHTPLICWKGSGYEFKGIRKDHSANFEVYRGKLKKGNDYLYTAWWYFNGANATIDQFTWRTDMLKGANRYCLINITSKDESTLNEYLKEILENNKLAIK
ncbi:MAG: exosortase N [Cyclobacteriaceae bacterium]|jgi:exosortase N|nr:exosortase N [Flammeovirgaceae bacterium]